MVGPPQNFLLFFGEIKIPEDLVRRFQETPAQVRLKRRLDEQLVYSWFGQVGYSLRADGIPPSRADSQLLLAFPTIAIREDDLIGLRAVA